MREGEELKGPAGYIAYDTLLEEKERHARKLIRRSLTRGSLTQGTDLKGYLFSKYPTQSVAA